MDRKTAHAAKCSKSLESTKYLVLKIESFEQQCVIIKGLFQSDILKQHRVTILNDKLLINNAMY